jgi:nicotinic acid mononucleotide adenylyltransferase
VTTGFLVVHKRSQHYSSILTTISDSFYCNDHDPPLLLRRFCMLQRGTTLERRARGIILFCRRTHKTSTALLLSSHHHYSDTGSSGISSSNMTLSSPARLASPSVATTSSRLAVPLKGQESSLSTFSTSTTASTASTSTTTSSFSTTTTTTGSVLFPHAATKAKEQHDYDEALFSLESLQTRMRAFVRGAATISSSSSCRICIAIAGGGGHFISTLAATPGASNILLQASVLYDREAYRQYTRQYNVVVAPSLSSSGIGVATAKDEKQEDFDSPTFRYASVQAATDAARAALVHGLRLGAAADPSYQHNDPLDNIKNVLGVGVASALRAEGSEAHKTSRAFVTVMPSTSVSGDDDDDDDDGSVQMQVTLAPTNTKHPNYDESSPFRIRTRIEQDVMVAHCILTCLEQALMHKASAVAAAASFTALTLNTNNTTGNTNGISSPSASHGNDTRVVVEESTTAGDAIRLELPSNSSSSFCLDPTRVIQRACRFILANEQNDRRGDKVVQLIPTTITSVDADGTERSVKTFQIIQHPVLPPNSFIFPGSFHPPHVGHLELVKAAASAASATDAKATTKSAGSSSRKQQQQQGIAWFELSVTNADKPPLSADQVVERLLHFLNFTNQDLPEHWGILLTNAPLFAQKVRLLHPLQVTRPNMSSSSSSSYSQESTLPPLSFVIGTDTLVRLLDPKYYDNSVINMIQAIDEMPVHFWVGGRLEQKKTQASLLPATFVTGQEHVQDCFVEHEHLKSKFSFVPQFRVDLSSTEIRNQWKLEKQQNQEK